MEPQIADGSAIPVEARIVLPGHADAEARMQVTAYPFWTRVLRTLGLAASWTAATVATFFITMFDPFISSIPLLMGFMSVYRSWKGRLRVHAFAGGCPRCGTAMTIEPGARISVPHPLVCYHCHHEPELRLG